MGSRGNPWELPWVLVDLHRDCHGLPWEPEANRGRCHENARETMATCFNCHGNQRQTMATRGNSLNTLVLTWVPKGSLCDCNGFQRVLGSTATSFHVLPWVHAGFPWEPMAPLQLSWESMGLPGSHGNPAQRGNPATILLPIAGKPMDSHGGPWESMETRGNFQRNPWGPMRSRRFRRNSPRDPTESHEIPRHPARINEKN